MDKVLVSINCITYNHEKYIVDAIEGFLMQKTNFKYEILIHDDASTDNTARIIRQYQSKYPDIIKPIIQTENQLSKGVRRIMYRFNHTRAKGKYIALCEGDDYWTDEYKLQKQVDYMEKNPDCSMCFHAAKIVNEDNTYTGKDIRMFTESRPFPSNELFYGAGKTNATASIVYRKEYLDNPPSWYFEAPVGDTPLALILSTKGYIYYIDEFMSNYRVGVGVSFNTRILDRKDKRIALREGLIYMLNEFDKYSNFNYTKDIQHKKLELEVLLIKDKGNVKGISLVKNDTYRKYIKRLKGKKKIINLIKDLFPRLYGILIRIKQLNR